MVLNGDTTEDLAKVLGITRQTLNNKIACRTDFTRPEMLLIKARYKLDNDEFFETFGEKVEL